MKVPFFSRFFEKRSDDTSTLSNPAAWLTQVLGFRPTKAGVDVSETSAMQSVAVLACVRVIAETVASMPLPVYRRLDKGKEKAPDHPLYKMLHDRPNSEMTSFSFRETLMTHLLLWGNAYAEIEYNRATGEIIGLWPLPPPKVEPKRSDSKQYYGINQGELFYRITLPDGTTKNLPAWQVLHIPGLGFNGIKGFSPVAMARDAIGLGLALEQFGSEYFKNGANVGAVVTHPGKLSDDAFTRLSKSLQEKYQGLGKAHRMMLLEEGMTFAKNTIPPNDSQFLESRKFQKNEICALFRVPPHMIADLDRATFSNIEHQSIDFIVHTIRPWLVRWEQTLQWKLFLNDETFFPEFLVDGLLRGDTASRYAAYAIGRQWGWLSANDIRALENMNDIGDEGDIYLIPMNMIPADQARLAEPKVAPPDDDPDDPEPTEDEDNNEDNNEDEEENARKVLFDLAEKRANEEIRKRSALARHRTARSYQNVFADATARIVRREKEKLLAEAKKQLGARNNQVFMDWVESFYDEFPDYIKRQIGPSVSSLAEAIKSLAEQEINGSEVDINPQVTEFLNGFVARYVKSSKGQMRYVINNAIEQELDPLTAVEDRLNEWEEKRPGKVAMDDTVQLSNFVAKSVFAASGITLLRWVNTGADTCEFCQRLDGMVVGIEENFLNAGEDLTSADGSLRVSGPKSQPPIHTGCECSIVAERG